MVKHMSLFAVAAALFMALTPQASWAVEDETIKVREATEVLQEIVSIPEDGIPEGILNQAHGIAVFPGLIKAGFGIGGRYGEGIMVTRTVDGWSNPVFMTLTGGSIGWQIGAQSTDLVLVFRSRDSVESAMRGDFTLGVQGSIAAGPVGRHAEAATDIALDAEIFSYSRNRGLFAGLALDGALLQIDHLANVRFYDQPGITTPQIIARTAGRTPIAALEFRCLVARTTNVGLQACG